jgi:hypothetical protein
MEDFDLIVRVNRINVPKYPSWKKELKNPELECWGPGEYHLSELSTLVIGRGIVNGYFIYNRLKELQLLSLCANLQDGYALLEKGPKVYLKRFGANASFLWSSTAISDDGIERVPYLFPHIGNLLMYWRDLSDSIGKNANATLFSPPQTQK